MIYEHVQNSKTREMFVVKSKSSLSLLYLGENLVLSSEAILSTSVLDWRFFLEIFLCVYKYRYIYIFLTQMPSYYSQFFKLGFSIYP